MSTGCPHCQAKLLPKDDQPEWGSHAISLKYECGAQVVYTIGGDYWEWEDECPAEVHDDGK